MSVSLSRNIHIINLPQGMSKACLSEAQSATMPLMPGVIMLEAAAQLCSYFAGSQGLFGDSILGFGGLEGVRFRDPVIPGDRLVIVCKMVKMRRNRIVISEFQGFVNDSLVVEGEIKGIPLPPDIVKQQLAKKQSS